MNPFKEIEGATLENIAMTHAIYVDADGKKESLKTLAYALMFDFGRLLIENPFFIESADHQEINAQELVGMRVQSAYFDEKEIRLLFENDCILAISLRDKDFTGPEAASFEPNNGPIIVFN